MDKIKIFDPNLGKAGEYINHWQCDSCEKVYRDAKNVWQCTTCRKDVCESCKNDSYHENHNTVKSDYTIGIAHPIDCDCDQCNDPYGFYIPTVDKCNNLTMSEDLILLGEGDYNPDMLAAQIPLLSSDFEYDIPNPFFGNRIDSIPKLFLESKNYRNIWGNNELSSNLETTIKWRADIDSLSLGKQISALYTDKSVWKINEERDCQ